MAEVFEAIKTPYKYGIVLAPPDSTKMIDSPTIFRMDSTWYMTYIVFDGNGYETWLAKSSDLLNWETKGRIRAFCVFLRSSPLDSLGRGRPYCPIRAL